jgi:hypothetical protein
LSWRESTTERQARTRTVSRFLSKPKTCVHNLRSDLQVDSVSGRMKMVRFGRQDGSPTLVELLHTVHQGPRLALFPRHSLFSQHSQHRRCSESQQKYTGRPCIVNKKRTGRTHLFTPVACTHETEQTSRTLVRVIVILLDLSCDMRRLQTRDGTSFLRAS